MTDPRFCTPHIVPKTLGVGYRLNPLDTNGLDAPAVRAVLNSIYLDKQRADMAAAAA
jgi:hypothetical protein